MWGVRYAVVMAAAVLAAPSPVQAAVPVRAAAPLPAAVPARAAAPAKGTKVCVINDERLDEISGMVATASGYAVMDDGSDLASHRKIFFLSRACAVTRAVSYPSRPRDPEDLTLAPDGTIWVADIGDNDESRETVALWKLAKEASTPVLYRLTYPDGPHDAEALVLTGDGKPVIVTKAPFTTGLYSPTGPLRQNKTVPMVKVGTFDPPSTDTSNPFSVAGRLLITGGATSPDGRRVVLRTYADAFEFDVTGGDVVKAITTGQPRITPLPDEPQGESITYSTDGTSLLTVSEIGDAPAGSRPAILRYAAAPAPVETNPAKATATAAATGKSTRVRDATNKVTLTDAAYFAGVIGLLLVIIGVRGRRRARR